MPSARYLTLTLPLLCLPAPAEPIYKSVDARGQVTYSNRPSANAAQSTSITVSAEPDPSARQEALQRSAEFAAQADQLRAAQNARQQEHRGRVAAASAALQEAEANLEQARIQQDDDWQSLQQGGRVLRESYFRRVENAERAVTQARDHLGQVRRDAP